MFHFLDEYYTFKEKVNKCWATHVEERRSDITEIPCCIRQGLVLQNLAI